MMAYIIKKREIFLFFLFLFLISTLNHAYSEVSATFWQTKKSDHFVIYFQDAPQDYVDELIRNAESYYNAIVDELGYRRFDFWTWDNRAKIYLFNSPADYLNDTGRVSWSGAMVNIKKRTIMTFINQQAFFESILPHEMTHIIFLEFVGLKRVLPLWLNEGIACSQEKTLLNERLQFARNLVKSNIYIALDKLTEINDCNLVVPQVFYAESASLVVFLFQEYGKDKFLDFSRKIKESKPWLQALMDTYEFKDLKDAEEKWKNFMLSVSLRNN